jgi:hypothetical protein
LNYPEKPHKEQIIQTLLVYLLIFFFLEKLGGIGFISLRRKGNLHRRDGKDPPPKHVTQKTPPKPQLSTWGSDLTTPTILSF